MPIMIPDVTRSPQARLALPATNRIIVRRRRCQAGGGPGQGDESPMKIHVRDVVSFFGRDYLVEGVVGYHVNGKRFQLARAVDGDAVLWVEPARDEADERLMVFKEVRDLEMTIPP